jgi:hypothetical protein
MTALPPAPDLHDEFSVRQALARATNGIGGLEGFASAHALDPDYIRDVLGGRASPNFKICRLMGFERLTVYRKGVF